MESAAHLRLQNFIEDHFDFDGLKKAGFFGKDIKRTDYEKIAQRVCKFFGLKSVYDYADMPPYGEKKVEQWQPLVLDKMDMISKDYWLN